jgi:hypothetical protein
MLCCGGLLSSGLAAALVSVIGLKSLVFLARWEREGRTMTGRSYRAGKIVQAGKPRADERRPLTCRPQPGYLPGLHRPAGF